MDAQKHKLFPSLDFSAVDDFTEEDVRAVIIEPILQELGFLQKNILREKQLQSPFLRTGSKKRKVTLIPDYILKVEQSFAWVLDAKSPAQKIIDDDNVEQVYSYATHPEIRSNYFALCNGLEFACFRTTETAKPVLYFRIAEIDEYWERLQKLLSPSSFQEGKTFEYEKPVARHKKIFDYATRPLLKEITVKKQQAKRHFGVHGYFTKQSWDIVAAYIKNFCPRGAVVLDPFGGSGVTAVEALMNGRRAINVDINPFAIFMVRALLLPVSFAELDEAYNKVRREYIKKEPKTAEEIEAVLEKYSGPRNLSLPRGSDVKTVIELFTKKQLAQLSLLKAIIKKQKNKDIINILLLAFSSSLNKYNLTFHYTKSAGGGDSAVFRYYRYRIAPDPGVTKLENVFEIKYKRILAAKKEIEQQCMLNQKSVEQVLQNAQIIKGSAANLSFLENESVDYIYTDPPYGKKIPYLDLSVMWNAWLDLDVSEDDYRDEAIEGGEHNKTKEEYNKLISQSIQEMYRVLKFDRWLSFVFAHKDPEFWHLIIETCEKCGFEYMGAVPQKNGQTSFKKRQHPSTVLSGQLIINFRKVRNPRAVLKANLGMDIGEIVLQTIEGIIAKNDGASIEEINDELIIKGLELGFLDLLKKEYNDLTPLLDRFDYDENSQKYTIKKDTKFQTHVDEKLRIRYYLISYLRRMERENKTPLFNDIVFAILPLLKNGITPMDQTIELVLKDIAEQTGKDGWKLKKEDNIQQELHFE